MIVLFDNSLDFSQSEVIPGASPAKSDMRLVQMSSLSCLLSFGLGSMKGVDVLLIRSFRTFCGRGDHPEVCHQARIPDLS